MNFSSDAMADFEGLLEVNRKICQQQMAEKVSPTLPTNCAVLPIFYRVHEKAANGQRPSAAQTAEKRHVFKRGYGVLAYSKEIKQEKIALTIRFIFWTAAVRKDCSYMLRIPSMRA